MSSLEITICITMALMTSFVEIYPYIRPMIKSYKENRR